MPRDPLEVREKRMLHLGDDALANPEAVRIHHEAKGMTEQHIFLDTNPDGGLIRTPSLHAPDYPFHDEPLIDGASDFIFAGGDVVVVTGVPN